MLEFGLSISFCAPSDYQALAQAADEAGFTYATLSDHLIYPKTLSKPYPYTDDGVPRFSETDDFPDPWIAVASMAAVTQKLKFYTNVYVLPARNPVHVAKILATAAVMSDYRLALGIGMGWMPEEFAAGEQPFARRGKRADEMIEVMRKLWTGEMVEHKGEFYDLPGVRMHPYPEQHIPIYVGGFSEPAMRRAARNDGWIADLHTKQELVDLMNKAKKYRVEAGGSLDDFKILSFGPMDAFGVDDYKMLAEEGLSTLTTMPWMFSAGPEATLEQKVDSIKKFGEETISQFS